MLGALAVGASADTAHMMKEFGGMGSAFYCNLTGSSILAPSLYHRARMNTSALYFEVPWPKSL